MTYLDDIQARIDRATPGPWEHIVLPCECGDCDDKSYPSCTAGYLAGLDGKSLYTVDCGDHHALTHDDSAFMAHSRTDLPELLRRLRLAIAELRHACNCHELGPHHKACYFCIVARKLEAAPVVPTKPKEEK